MYVFYILVIVSLKMTTLFAPKKNHFYLIQERRFPRKTPCKSKKKLCRNPVFVKLFSNYIYQLITEGKASHSHRFYLLIEITSSVSFIKESSLFLTSVFAVFRSHIYYKAPQKPRVCFPHL